MPANPSFAPCGAQHHHTALRAQAHTTRIDSANTLDPHLWGHVIQRAHPVQQLVMQLVCHKPKVPQLQLPTGGQEDVFCLDVTVDDVQPVEEGKRGQQRRNHLQPNGGPGKSWWGEALRLAAY